MKQWPGLPLRVQAKFQIEVIQWSGFSGKDTRLEERRVRRPLFEQEVPEGRGRGEEGKEEEKDGCCGRDRVGPRPT